jgi:hypothetical protein
MTMDSTSTHLPGAGLYQLAYATNDFEQALEQCATIYGAREFAKLFRINIDLGAGRTVVCNLALAWVGTTQLEVIQPLEGEVAVYAEGLPSSGFGLKLHHLARLHATREDVEAQAAKYRREGRALPIDAEAPGWGRYCYADFRRELGHYIEHAWFAPRALEWQASLPRFS